MKSSQLSTPEWLSDGSDSSLLKITMLEFGKMTENEKERVMLQLTALLQTPSRLSSFEQKGR